MPKARIDSDLCDLLHRVGPSIAVVALQHSDRHIVDRKLQIAMIRGKLGGRRKFGKRIGDVYSSVELDAHGENLWARIELIPMAAPTDQVGLAGRNLLPKVLLRNWQQGKNGLMAKSRLVGISRREKVKK